MSAPDLATLRARRYHTILADPPWPITGGKNGKRGWSKTVSADAHYSVMSVGAIKALPVERLAAADAHLYLWAPNNLLPDAFDVLEAWGFRYVTLITWGKTSGYGLGQYFRGQTEQCLFGVRGAPGYRRERDGKRRQGTTLLLAPRAGRHSAKPPAFYETVERVSRGPYLELFARDARKGWTAWGDEVSDG